MKERIVFGVIILNYFSYQETVNCVESFSNAQSDQYDVRYVIVDNGSNNQSYDILCSEFASRDDIDVIETGSNVGFAKGNNIGCDYLKRKYDCDFMVFSNSDILVPNNIFTWILEVYDKYNCDIMGPDIYAPNLETHQNPIKKYTEKEFVVTLKILKKSVEKFLLKYKIDVFRRRYESPHSHFVKCNYYDVPVHGSFIVSNMRIFDNYSQFFDDRTFLYMEEYLLFLRCKQTGLKTMVCLDNQVIHLQGKSTDVQLTDARAKRIMRLSREISSMKIYRTMLKN